MQRRKFIKTVATTTTAGAGLAGATGSALGASRSYEYVNGVQYLKVSTGGGPLVMCLHGCSQEPSDFADAIQANYWCDQYGYSAVFPNMNDFDNFADCWEWWEDWETSRGSNAAYYVADIMREEKSTLGASEGYILGFSAGAAMAPDLAAHYPDLYDACGIHSGCEYDAADSSWGANSVMASGGPDPQDQGWAAYDAMTDDGFEETVPTVVFQGTDDTTVEPPNGRQCAEQGATLNYYVTGGGDYALSQADKTSDWDGKSYDKYTFKDNDGNVSAEFYNVDGLEHDWSGGSSSRYYTDPDAPEATNLMFDFFRDNA